MITDWSGVPANEVNRPVKEKVSGISMDVMAAYFDVPVAVRFMLDEDRRELVVEFKYLTDPELTIEDEQHDIWLLIGKHTRRIYKMGFKGDLIGCSFNKAITQSMVVDADSSFKSNKKYFSNLNEVNSRVVENFLDWGSHVGHLNLAAAN